MTLEEYKLEAARLRSRIKEVGDIIKTTTDATERMRQTERKKVLQTMYRETMEEVNRLQSPEQRPHRRRKARLPSVSGDAGTLGLDFFSAAALAWDDLDGTSWDVLERVANTGEPSQKERLLRVLRKAMGTLTPRQAELIGLRFGRGLKLQEIADCVGVGTGTVSRVLRRGIRRIQDYIVSTLLVERCIDRSGAFDFMAFAELSNLLTERQREETYLLLSDDARLTDIANWQNRRVSTVCHTNDRIVGRLDGLGNSLAHRPNAVKISMEDWANLPEQTVCEMLGIRPWTFFQLVAPPVGAMPRHHYEVLRLFREGHTVRQVSDILGCSPETARKIGKQYDGIDLSTLPEPEPYRPRPCRHLDDMDIKTLLRRTGSGRATVGDAVSDAQYKQMLALTRP